MGTSHNGPAQGRGGTEPPVCCSAAGQEELKGTEEEEEEETPCLGFAPWGASPDPTAC